MSEVKKSLPLKQFPPHILVQIITRLRDRKNFYRMRKTCRWVRDFIEENRHLITYKAYGYSEFKIGKFAPTIFNRRFSRITDEDRKELQGLIVRKISMEGGQRKEDEVDFDTLISVMKTMLYDKERFMDISSIYFTPDQFSAIMELSKPIWFSHYGYEKFNFGNRKFESVENLSFISHQDFTCFPNAKRVTMSGDQHSDICLYGGYSTLPEVQQYFKDWLSGRYNFEDVTIWTSFPTRDYEKIRDEFYSGIAGTTCNDRDVYKKIETAYKGMALQMKTVPIRLIYRKADDQWAFVMVFSYIQNYESNFRRCGVSFMVIPKSLNADMKAAAAV